MTHKLIIDTDPGIDDAMAIFYAALHPEIEILGMTSVFGNVTTEIAARNAIVLAERAGQTIPVAKGAAKPLVQPPNPVSDYVHGIEGFGDVPAQDTIARPVDEPAHEFICRLINENPGEITLCPIGPLTNIALALRHDPSIAGKVKSVVIMGGGLERGNVTAHAEANIWNDPHSADEVFAAEWEVTMVGLDVTTQVVCQSQDFARIAETNPKLGGFLNDAVQYYLKFYETHVGVQGSQMHDPTAVIAITDPQYFTIENHALEVIVEGDRIGQTIRSTDPSRPKHKVPMGVDIDGVKRRFITMFETGS
ncbi:nucleoside hydrolase [Neptunicoccus cionae]|uniref:Nucleoside hydrolase n=1 Tax=Neptunicoccus cionae TaxID=2035344 RepID=A0A916QWI4_9RHOB|nr:nucleoside hydrolase [Amylibacter cionae]GGA16809.1 nucleoside hydrolase [Amylibacter cionae]